MIIMTIYSVDVGMWKATGRLPWNVRHVSMEREEVERKWFK